MTYFLLTYITFSCPGFFLSGIIPQSTKSVVCSQESEAELISSKKEAYRKAEELVLKGQSPNLYWCKNFKCKKKEISVNKSVTIE